jgi:hypothetical protein
VTLGKKPDELLDDESALKVIKRKANQRKDSIEQFEKGGRSELADKERAELENKVRDLYRQTKDEPNKKGNIKKKFSLKSMAKNRMKFAIGGSFSENSTAYRNISPAQKREAFLFNDLLNGLLFLKPLIRVLGKKNKTSSVISLRREIEPTLRPASLAEKFVWDLNE